MKVLVIGGCAGGASVAARVRRLDEHAEVIMFEKGPNVSYSNCCLPFHLSGMIEKSESLVLMCPDVFKKQYNIEARVKSEVIAIQPDKKSITVKNLETNEKYEETYDKLALAPGAEALLPESIEGIHSDHVFIVKNVVDIHNIQTYITSNNLQDIAVVGAGYVGLEVCENLTEAGKTVHLIEASSHVLPTEDFDIAQILHKELHDNGVDLHLNDRLTAIKNGTVVLASGKEVKAEAVIMAIGVRPSTKLAESCGIKLGETGGILVNYNYQTNYPDIYAVGDAIEVTSRITRKKMLLALAGPAQRQARAAADHMFGKYHSNKGVIGSSCVHLFGLNVADTGISEVECQELGIKYDIAYTIPGDKVGLMPNANPIFFKLIFEDPTGRLLGAQAIGKGNVDKRMDVIATMLYMGGTLEDLRELELCYSPHYGTAKDVVNHTALVALNLLHGDFKQVHVTKVRELVEKNACIIDVREPDEFARGHIVNAKNIPMSEFRQRVDEFPKDEPVYLHCRSSQRSYNVILALQAMGFTNLYNIAGSFLGLSFYEYYEDQTTGRDKIVTEYNFN